MDFIEFFSRPDVFGVYEQYTNGEITIDEYKAQLRKIKDNIDKYGKYYQFAENLEDSEDSEDSEHPADSE